MENDFEQLVRQICDLKANLESKDAKLSMLLISVS
jgi:hypothetical protein